MSYRVRVERAARKALADVPTGVQRQIVQRLAALADEPRPRKAEALKGKLRGLHKLRVRSYRIAYQIDDDARAITVWEVGHRSRAYQDTERRRKP